LILSDRGLNVTLDFNDGDQIRYALRSTDEQDLTAQRAALLELGVTERRFYLDHATETAA